MKDKLLILSVRSAKTFTPRVKDGFTQGKDTHRMIVDGVPVKRLGVRGGWLEVPCDTFAWNHVSGALHVLCGERPVPTLRKSAKAGSPCRVSRIDDLAKSSLVRVTSGIYPGKEGVKVRTIEALMTRKSSTSSTDPATFPLDITKDTGRGLSLLNWDRFRASLKPEDFNSLISVFRGELGLGEDTSLLHVLRASHSSEGVRSYVESSALKDPWKSLILLGHTEDAKSLRSVVGSSLNKACFHYTVPKGKEGVHVRDAFVYVPVDEDDLSLFRRGTGYATLLDGGVVTVAGVCDFYDHIVLGCQKVFIPGV